MSESRAKWSNLLVMAAFGTMSLAVKHIPLGSAEIAMERAVIGAVTLVLAQLVGGRLLSSRELKGELPLLLLNGGILGFGWILLFQAYRYTSVSVATLAYYFAPVLITVGCAVWFREKMNGRQIVCFVCATAGLVLMLDPRHLAAGGASVTGILLALGSAVCYAAVVLMNKKIRTVTGMDRTLMQLAAAAVVLLPYVLFTGGIHAFSMTAGGWVSLLILGVFYTGLCYVVYFSTLSHLPGRTVALLSYADPLTAVLCSLLILGEGISAMQAVGGAMVIGFTLLNERWGAPKE